MRAWHCTRATRPMIDGTALAAKPASTAISAIVTKSSMRVKAEEVMRRVAKTITVFGGMLLRMTTIYCSNTNAQ